MASSSKRKDELPVDLQYFDPDQDVDERRRLHLDMHNLTRDFDTHRHQLMHGEPIDVVNFVEHGNNLMGRVRNTLDARTDSRFLLAVGDMASERSTSMVADSSGIDVDDFVSRCIQFMQNNNSDAITDADDESETMDDAHGWSILGARACSSRNRRPPVPGFLLGPLSMVPTANENTRVPRQVRVKHESPAETRPEVVMPETLAHAESQHAGGANVISLVQQIRADLASALQKRMSDVDDELNEYGDPSQDVIDKTMEKHGLALIAMGDDDQDPAMSLFEFAINPHSFGQSVENLFYVSFLIREGSVRIGKDKYGLPLICPSQARALNKHRGEGGCKSQAVLSMDYPLWQKFIQAFDIKEPSIAHR